MYHKQCNTPGQIGSLLQLYHIKALKKTRHFAMPPPRPHPTPPTPPTPPHPAPEPPLDPSGPSAGRVVVSADRRFDGSSILHVPKAVVPCLVDETRIQEAKAAACANGGTIPKYVVTVYARRAGEDGPPMAFQDVALAPRHLNRRENLVWYLTGLGPLRQHLGLGPRSPVRLVREVGQDGRVRLVVEPRGEGKGERPVKRVEAEEDSDAGDEDEHGVLLRGGGDTSCGSEADGESELAGGSGDSEESSDGEATGSDDPNWVPGRGVGQGAEARGRAQPQQEPQPQQQQQQQQQRQSPVLPQSPLQPKPPQQQPGPGGGGGGGNDAGQPQQQPQQQEEKQQPLGTANGLGGGGAGPSGAVGPGAGEAGQEPWGGEEGRPAKKRRLEVGTEQAGERLTGQHGKGICRVPEPGLPPLCFA